MHDLILLSTNSMSELLKSLTAQVEAVLLYCLVHCEDAKESCFKVITKVSLTQTPEHFIITTDYFLFVLKCLKRIDVIVSSEFLIMNGIMIA